MRAARLLFGLWMVQDVLTGCSAGGSTGGSGASGSASSSGGGSGGVSGSASTGSGASGAPTSGSTASGSATSGAPIECTSSAGCPAHEICGFPRTPVCGTKGQCFAVPAISCLVYAIGCACDGTEINIACTGLPDGYDTAPLRHTGECVDGG